MLAAFLALLVQCPDGSPPPCARPARVAAISPSSVAVLYFENHSRDTTDAQLADGLTEELITRLSQVNRLEVKSRYESRRVRGSEGDPRDIGRTLRAAYLVSGSLQQAGSRVRINVALLRTSTGAQVWGDIYDRSGDVLSIQSDIASAVAGAITGRLLPSERATLTRRPTRDPESYALYLRGVAAANTITESGMRSALSLFDQAIARDSSFADPWAGKAWVWMWLADGYVLARQAFDNVRQAANRALALDSSQATAWSLLALATQALDLDHAAARSLARRAMVADPRSSMGHVALASSYEFDREMDSAVAEGRAAYEADTLSAVMTYLYIDLLREAGRIDQIDAFLPRARAALDSADVRQWAGLVAERRGDFQRANQLLSWRYYGGKFGGAAVAARVGAGQREAAAAMRDSAVAYADTAYFNPYGLAKMYGALGDADGALRNLERAWEQRTIWLCDMRLEPEFEFLRGQPRFIALMRRLGYSP